jgi:hypothetical protein
MEAAEAFALSHMHVNFMLLFCRPALQGFYEHLGWMKVASPVWGEQVATETCSIKVTGDLHAFPKLLDNRRFRDPAGR